MPSDSIYVMTIRINTYNKCGIMRGTELHCFDPGDQEPPIFENTWKGSISYLLDKLNSCKVPDCFKTSEKVKEFLESCKEFIVTKSSKDSFGLTTNDGLEASMDFDRFRQEPVEDPEEPVKSFPKGARYESLNDNFVSDVIYGGDLLQNTITWIQVNLEVGEVFSDVEIINYVRATFNPREIWSSRECQDLIP